MLLVFISNFYEAWIMRFYVSKAGGSWPPITSYHLIWGGSVPINHATYEIYTNVIVWFAIHIYSIKIIGYQLFS